LIARRVVFGLLRGRMAFDSFRDFIAALDARIRGCVRRGKAYIQRVAATDMIEQIRQLPNREAVRLYEYLFSEAGELDRLLAAFDRLPRKTRLTEKEILNLPRARSARQ
jgi:hypothetical protein